MSYLAKRGENSDENNTVRRYGADSNKRRSVKGLSVSTHCCVNKYYQSGGRLPRRSLRPSRQLRLRTLLATRWKETR